MPHGILHVAVIKPLPLTEGTLADTFKEPYSVGQVSENGYWEIVEIEAPVGTTVSSWPHAESFEVPGFEEFLTEGERINKLRLREAPGFRVYLVGVHEEENPTSVTIEWVVTAVELTESPITEPEVIPFVGAFPEPASGMQMLL